MWNIQIENNVKRVNKPEENMKKAYAMIFKEFCTHQIQTRIKYHHKNNSIINDHLKIIYTIAKSMHYPIQETYPYISLPESLARMTNTRQQEKGVLM